MVQVTKTYYCQHCKAKITVADIDNIYQTFLTEYLQSFGATDFFSHADSMLKEKNMLLTKTINERKKLSKKFETLLEIRTNGELTKEQFSEHSQPLSVRIAQLDETMPELQEEVDFLSIQRASGDVVLDEAKQLSEKWEQLPFNEKRSIVETITDNITIKNDVIDIDLCFLPTSSKTTRIVDTSMGMLRQLFLKQLTLVNPKKVLSRISARVEGVYLPERDILLLRWCKIW